MKRILIHIGNLKTGSTAIQRVLCTLRQDIAAHGILMPGLDEKIIAHHAINQEYGKTGAGAARTRVIFDAITAAPEGSTLLLTAETFMAVPPDWLKERLIACGATDFTVLAYVRPHISMMGSMYLQNVKNGLFHGAVTDHLRLLRGAPMQFMAVIEDWGRAFGQDNLIVREFSRPVLRDGSVVTDFWDMFALPPGLRARAAEVEELSNPTPSAEMALLLRAASNHLIGEAPQRQRDEALEGDRNSDFRRAIRYLFARLCDASDRLPDTRYRLPLDLQEAMNRHFQADRQAFAAKWFRQPATQSWMVEEVAAPGTLRPIPLEVLREVVQQANKKLRNQDATAWARRMRGFMAKLPRDRGPEGAMVQTDRILATFGLQAEVPVTPELFAEELRTRDERSTARPGGRNKTPPAED